MRTASDRLTLAPSADEAAKGGMQVGDFIMAMRTAGERVYQTLAYEAGGLVFAAPLYGFVFGREAGESFALLMSLSMVVIVWAPIHNIIFDWVEFERTGRVASDRPQGLRAAHALCLEITAAAVTLPLVMAMGGHDFWQALMIDIGLTLFYAAYAYFFHIAYDRLRPVSRAPFRAGTAQQWNTAR
jgi:uncharacterized membrane protein